MDKMNIDSNSIYSTLPFIVYNVLRVYLLKEQRDKIHSERLNNQNAMNKLVEVRSFLDDQTGEIEEYNDQLVRNLVERITMFDDHLGVKFRTGAEIEIYTTQTS